MEQLEQKAFAQTQSSIAARKKADDVFHVCNNVAIFLSRISLCLDRILFKKIFHVLHNPCLLRMQPAFIPSYFYPSQGNVPSVPIAINIAEVQFFPPASSQRLTSLSEYIHTYVAHMFNRQINIVIRISRSTKNLKVVKKK